MQQPDIVTREVIRESYGKIAVQGGGCCGGPSSFSPRVVQTACRRKADLTPPFGWLIMYLLVTPAKVNPFHPQ